MSDLSLEREFEQAKALHKYSVLKAKMVAYFQTLEESQVNVPNFQRIGQRAIDLADIEIRHLLCRGDGGVEFNRLYELAYDELNKCGAIQ